MLTYFPIKRLVPKIKLFIKLILKHSEPRRIRGWAIFYLFRFKNSLDIISEFRWLLKVSANKMNRKTNGFDVVGHKFQRSYKINKLRPNYQFIIISKPFILN